jgi:hypothetical protein
MGIDIVTQSSTQQDTGARRVTRPCIVGNPPAWVPLTKAQVLRMAIELRRIRAAAKQDVAAVAQG